MMNESLSPDKSDVDNHGDHWEQRIGNKLYLWEGSRSASIISPPLTPGISVEHVSFGARHLSILTSDGQLFMSGANDFGQLGIGTASDVVTSQFCSVPRLSSFFISDVSCGRNHTVALTSTGQVFAWGDGSKHQCGVGQCGIYTYPQSVSVVELGAKGEELSRGSISSIGSEISDEVRFVQVSCGWYHTVAISRGGEVWVWGSGLALGLGNIIESSTPRLVEYLSGKMVLSVVCGSNHTLALISKSSPSKLDDAQGEKDSQSCNRCNRFCISRYGSVRSLQTWRQISDVQGSIDVEETVSVTSTEQTSAELSKQCDQIGNKLQNQNGDNVENKSGLNDASFSKAEKCDLTMNDELNGVKDCNNEMLSNQEEKLRDSAGELSNSNKSNTITNETVKKADEKSNTEIKETLLPNYEGGNNSDISSEILSNNATCVINKKLSNANVVSVNEIEKSEPGIANTGTHSVDVAQNSHLTQHENVALDIPASITVSASGDTSTKTSYMLPTWAKNSPNNEAAVLPAQVLSPSISYHRSISCEGATISKSRSTFLSEAEAKEFLEKQLQIADDTSSVDMSLEDGISKSSAGLPLKDIRPFDDIPDVVPRSLESGLPISIPASSVQNSGKISKSLDSSYPESVHKNISATEMKTFNSDKTEAQEGIVSESETDSAVPAVHDEIKKRNKYSEAAALLDSSVLRRLSDNVPQTVKDTLTRQLESSQIAKTVESFLLSSRKGTFDEDEGVAGTTDLSDKDSGPLTPTSKLFSFSSVESLRQRVPSVGTLRTKVVPGSPVVVQEYVTQLKRNVATSLRSSVDRLTGGVGPGGVGEVTAGDYGRSVLAGFTGGRGLLGQGEVGSMGEGGGISSVLGVNELSVSGAWSVPKSASQHALDECQTRHRRNASLPTSALCESTGQGCRTCDGFGRIELDTEVWSWGQGSNGQLGHGDTLDRCQPCPVIALNDLMIVKLSASSCQSIALSASSQVYGWGDNSSGQLGHTATKLPVPHVLSVKAKEVYFYEKPVIVIHLVPVKIEKSLVSAAAGEALNSLNPNYTLERRTHSVYGCLPCWDVDSGPDHTLLLCDGITESQQPSVYHCGKDEEDQLIRQPARMSMLKEIGLVHRVYAGTQRSACIVQPRACAGVAELGAQLRGFHRLVTKIYNSFVRPLVECEPDSEIMESSKPVGSSLQQPSPSPAPDSLRDLSVTLDALCRVVAVTHLELTKVTRGSLDLALISPLRDPDTWLTRFYVYFKSYTSLLACGSFEKCVKANRDWFDKVKDEFGGILEDDKVNLNDLSLTFKNLLYLPYQQPREMKRVLEQISQKYPAYTPMHARLQKLMTALERLRQTARVEYKLAETTAAFWKSASVKLIEALRAPQRRLIRESKTHPLQLSTAGRFSSPHNFVLFNDCFVDIQYSGHVMYPLNTVWIEVLQNSKHIKNAISIITPEETLTLTAPSHSDKVEWVWCLNQAISQTLASERLGLAPVNQTSLLCSTKENQTSITPLALPKVRHASHTFTKLANLKEAKYIGAWLNGKMSGRGELQWLDGRSYRGEFVDGQFEGFGVYVQPRGEEGTLEISEGTWRGGSLHGYGIIRYSNGDVYKGHLVEGKRNGHGVMKQGKLITSQSTVMYTGHWSNDKKHGYGVCDYICKGHRYMGMWCEDSCHGNGIIVTVDGLYFEGNFSYGKMTGQGTLVTEDGTWYSGEFSGGSLQLYGKGMLSFSNGDHIEGHFSGSMVEGVKVSGMFRKATAESGDTLPGRFAEKLSKSLGRYSVSADNKWEEIFSSCLFSLGCSTGGGGDSVTLSANSSEVVKSNDSVEKVWEKVAAMMSAEKLNTISSRRQSKNISGSNRSSEELQFIPAYHSSPLTADVYLSIKSYLIRAFDSTSHPLGQLLETLIDSFLSSYVGIGAHVRLLTHALQEFISITNRIYRVVRLLFPQLPECSEGVLCLAVNGQLETEDSHDNDSTDSMEPLLYAPLFNLYVLHNQKEDERYWKRVRLWNKQSALSLMIYLGVDSKFLPTDEAGLRRLNSGGGGAGGRGLELDDMFSTAIERLQHVRLSFSPGEKLSQIQLTFNEITQMVQSRLGSRYQWSMDDLFPVFQYVVVRSRIQHLGAEIHFTEDLMEPQLRIGELGIMFTTLKACYVQILSEKVL